MEEWGKSDLRSTEIRPERLWITDCLLIEVFSKPEATVESAVKCGGKIIFSWKSSFGESTDNAADKLLVTYPVRSKICISDLI